MGPLQHFGLKTPGGSFLTIGFSALIWVGTYFAGYAIYLAFLRHLDPVGAAAAAAAFLLAVPFGYFAIHLLWPRASQPAPENRPMPADTDKATLRMLADVAKQTPLFAVLVAGLLGAAETIRKGRD